MAALNFDKIICKNILSVGQAPLVIDLSSFRLTALHGPSGSGKSTLLDALSYVLFGRAFRDINKSDLVNSINGKNLLVEIFFSIGQDKYKVSRGYKPAVFEIEVNGIVLNQDAHSKDQQKYLEDQILKMNWRMFTHVVILGAANYTPFMRLKPSDRKKMVENILGIDVFSTMNAIIKQKISDAVIEFKSLTDKRENNKKQILFLQEQQKTIENKQKTEIEELRIKLLKKKDENTNLSQIVKAKETEIFNDSAIEIKVNIPEFTETFTETFTEIFTETFTKEFTETFTERLDSEFSTSELVSQKATATASGKSLEEKNKALKKTIQFYNDNDNCPTCSQTIEKDFKTKTLSDLVNEQTANDTSIKELIAEIKKFNTTIEEIDNKKKEYLQSKENFKKRKDAFDAEKRSFETRQSSFEQKRRAFEDRQRSFETRRRTHEEKLKAANQLLDEKKKEFEKVIEKKKAELQGIKDQITALLAEAKLLKESIEEKKAKPLFDNSNEINKLTAEGTKIDTEIDSIGKQIKLSRETQAIIKDDGIKAEILKRYIPTLNRYINNFITKMGLYVHFELDQEFNDTIRSRHKDVLSYANYSEGERQRIDLAVLLAWRQLAQSQSAVNTNLLILDEVLDSYLDHTTTESILELMKGDDFNSFNIIVISHKDGITESFDRIINFKKTYNFTAIS